MENEIKRVELSCVGIFFCANEPVYSSSDIQKSACNKFPTEEN